MSVGRWVALLAALFVLNFALTFHNVWPTPWIATRHELSVEIALVIVVVALWRGLVGPLPRRALNAAAVVLVVMALGRYAEVTAPALYGRRINLFWDARHVPGVARMLAEATPVWLLVTGGIGIAALLVAAFFVLRWSLERVQRACAHKVPRRALGVLGTALVAYYALGYAPVPLDSWRWFSMPVSTTYYRQAVFVREALDEQHVASELPAERSFSQYDLERVAGTDVLLMFVESYGAVAYDAPGIDERLEPGRARLAEAADATGRGVVSAFATSPTIGGASWLAHSSFVTGLPIDDQAVYELLLTQQRESLTTLFADEDYRVTAAMPGLRNAWPEGAFYEFDTIYDAEALEYPGPAFGWWRIPDQYTLARVDAAELSRPAPPAFVFFATISTHMPFKPTPPYVGDWPRLFGDAPYDAGRIADRLDEKPDWTNLRPAYADSLAYTYEYLAGYLERRREAPFVLVVLGDHQPPTNVAGEGARWDVPVHVVTGNEAVLDALERAGFTAGLRPAHEPVGALHELTDVLLSAFSAE